MARVLGRRPALPPPRLHPHPPRARAGRSGRRHNFNFVTDGIESALEQAREAAGGKDVSLGGGATTVQQYLGAGLLDEMTITLVPVFLGGGTRLFDELGRTPRRPEQVEAIEAPGVTHLRYRFR